MSQWANFRSLNSTNGWSAYGGQVFGVYYPQQDPSGSSSGSGVSSAIGLALASLGTEVSLESLWCIKHLIVLDERQYLESE